MQTDASRYPHPIWPRRPAHSREFIAAGDDSRAVDSLLPVCSLTDRNASKMAISGMTEQLR